MKAATASEIEFDPFGMIASDYIKSVKELQKVNRSQKYRCSMGPQCRKSG